jgi:IS5 family transposase
MTQDEIIEMARQAGLSNPLWIENDYAIIESFAKLVAEAVASKEREANAKLKELAQHYGGTYGDAIRARDEA